MLSLPYARRGTAALALVVALFACTGGPAPSSGSLPTETGSTPTVAEPDRAVAFSHLPNPVRPGNFPDPFVLVTDSLYYAFSTNSATANVPVLQSSDLVTWTDLGDAMPLLPSWAVSGKRHTWAPAVLAIGKRYVLFYTARDGQTNLQCLGRAESPNPAGPFIDGSARPFVCQTDLGGSIDPSVVRDSSAQVYLLWKNDGNCCGRPVTIWSQPLSRDASTLEGVPAALLRRDQPWEGALIEAPSMWQENGSWHLLYSGNLWNTDQYAIGYAECETPLGPCRKVGEGPVMASDGETAGPGGAEVFSDHEGRRWIAYHGWSAPLVGYASGGVRSLRLDRIDLVRASAAEKSRDLPSGVASR
jgi:beta-xylosidase